MIVGYHVPRSQFQRLELAGADVVQTFMSAPKSFTAPKGETKMPSVPVWAHTPYVLNVASSGNKVRRQTFDSIQSEVLYAAEVGAVGVVVHAGVTKSRSYWFECWDEVVHRLDIPESVTVAVENVPTKGEGGKPKNLRSLVETYDRLSLCVDTCHAWVAGYDPEEFVAELGGAPVALVHANNSKREQGAGRDGHENLETGSGQIDDDVLVRAIKATGSPHAVCETDSGRGSAKWLRERL